MSQPIKHATATLAAAACLALASGVQAQGAFVDEPLYLMTGTSCHPVRGGCVKFQPSPPAATQQVRLTADEELILLLVVQPYSAACHPTIRSCWASQGGTNPSVMSAK